MASNKIEVLRELFSLRTPIVKMFPRVENLKKLDGQKIRQVLEKEGAQGTSR